MFRGIEKGQGYVEYALILILVAVVLILVLNALGDTLIDTYTYIDSDLNF